jgi:hypothetical protein
MAVFFVALRGSPAFSVLKNPWPDVRCSGERPDTGRAATGLAGKFCRETGGAMFRIRQFADGCLVGVPQYERAESAAITGSSPVMTVRGWRTFERKWA